MQYLGGKSKVGKRIAETCLRGRAPGALFVDMFCGALNVVRHVTGPRLAIDACGPLMYMWHCAINDGWVPPTVVTRDEYDLIKKRQNPKDPMTAFVMFGCSFGGKWAGGYASTGSKNPHRTPQKYAESAAHSIAAKVKDCVGLELEHATFQSKAPGCWPAGTVLYCDPPYAGTTGYKALEPFNSDAFWAWAYRHAKKGVRVFVSEYNAPPGWEVVDEQTAPQGGRLTPGKTPRVDRLFTYTRGSK